MKQAITLTALAILAVAGIGWYFGQSPTAAQDYQTPAPTQTAQPAAQAPAQPTIVDIATTTADFSTLATAVQQADLVDTLNSEGPFTVFAPTNAAFDALPAGTLEAVLADKEQLTAILTYHVVPGKVMAADVVNLDSATTVQGGQLDIAVSDSGVHINDAKVLTTDVEASNGVIHIIDSVLLPQ